MQEVWRSCLGKSVVQLKLEDSHSAHTVNIWSRCRWKSSLSYTHKTPKFLITTLDKSKSPLFSQANSYTLYTDHYPLPLIYTLNTSANLVTYRVPSSQVKLRYSQIKFVIQYLYRDNIRFTNKNDPPAVMF